MAATATSAFRDGLRRVKDAPVVLVGMFLVTLLVALPLSAAVMFALQAHLGTSLAADAALAGSSLDWWQEFSSQASGVASTFLPTIVGFAAVLDNVSRLVDGGGVAGPAIALAIAAWLLIWSFLSGGVIDRYARRRPTRAAGFFAACGTHVWRFARLGVLALLVYWVLFAGVHSWLFDFLYPRLTRDITVERTAFFIRLVCYAVFGFLLITCNIIFDYARVRLVVEDRRSAIGALLGGARFVRRHHGVWALYMLNAAAYLGIVLVYAIAAPGSPRAGATMWVALGLGQLYVLARHYVKLTFYASQTSFFQSALAHDSYTAAPAVVWPESPAAEAVLNTPVKA